MKRRAITLLELLLAIGLIALVMMVMFTFYDVTLRERDRGTRMVTDGSLARRTALKLADEVRSASGFLGNGDPGVWGTERFLSIQTAVLPEKDHFIPRAVTDNPPPARCDIRQVQYYLAYDYDENHEYPDGTVGPRPLGLARREIKTLNQTVLDEARPDSVELDLFAPELKYFRIRYFDGVDWIDRWDLRGGFGGLANSLPQAVELTLGYDEMPPPDEQELDLTQTDLLPALPEPFSRKTFTVQVRLPQADVFFGSRLLRAQQRSSKLMEAAGGGATP
jgi:hypothetical protein